MSLVTGLLPFTSEMALFPFPFNELLIWAVLTKRQQMAHLMWTHGEEALAKSLVACKLYKAMAHEAADDDLDTEIYDELRNYAKEFEQKGLRLLDFCYRQDAEKTQKLLTCELTSWSNQSCLSLAVAANHRAILAHPCSQVILADLWMGALRTRKNTNLNVRREVRCEFVLTFQASLLSVDSGGFRPDCPGLYQAFGVQDSRRAPADAADRRRTSRESILGLRGQGEVTHRR